jgi:hypothetical protein
VLTTSRFARSSCCLAAIELRLLLVVIFFLLIERAPALAQSTAVKAQSTLTSRGRLMPGGRISGFWSNDRPSNYGSFSTWTVNIAPSLVYFVRDNLGVGLALGGSYSEGGTVPATELTSRAFALGAVAVWNLPLAGRISLMLRPFIGYARSWSDTMVTGNAAEGGALDALPTLSSVHVQSVAHSLRVALELPFVYAINDHVGVGIGPDLAFDHFFDLATTVAGGAPSHAPRRNRLWIGASVSVYASF